MHTPSSPLRSLRDLRCVSPVGTARFATKSHHEIANDGSIDHDNSDAGKRDTSPEFVDLQRNEGARYEDREVLRPSLPQEETRALGQQERGVDEYPRTRVPKSPGVDTTELRQH